MEKEIYPQRSKERRGWALLFLCALSHPARGGCLAREMSGLDGGACTRPPPYRYGGNAASRVHRWRLLLNSRARLAFRPAVALRTVARANYFAFGSYFRSKHANHAKWRR